MIYNSPFDDYQGHIELPDRFTGEMFDYLRVTYADLRDGDIKKNISDKRLFAYALVNLVEKFGKWGVENVTIKDLEKWFGDPSEEDMMLVSWLEQVSKHYTNRFLNPFLLPPEYGGGSKKKSGPRGRGKQR